MTRTSALPALLAAVMVAGVIGTYSLVGAQDEGERLERREREEPELRLAQRDRRDEEIDRRERQERQRRERQEDARREQMRQQEEEARRRERERLGPRPEPPFPPEQLEQFARMMQMVKHMQHTCFDPEAAAMVAVAGLRDDMPRKPEEVVDDLEATLKRTRTLGLRNAIRLILRDLYRHLGRHDRMLENLREMLVENDEAIQAEMGRPKHEPGPRPDDRRKPKEHREPEERPERHRPEE